MAGVSPTSIAPKLSISAITPSPHCTLLWTINPPSTYSVTLLSFGISTSLTALYTSAVTLSLSPSIKLATYLGMGECGIIPRVLPTSLDCATSLTMISTGSDMNLKKSRTSLSLAPRTARRLISVGQPVVYTGHTQRTQKPVKIEKY